MVTMIWQATLAMFLLGLLLIARLYWLGLFAAVMIATSFVALYGYPTSSWFLPDDFYLVGIHGDNVWIEEREDSEPRAFALDVPASWREAFETSGRQPIRIARGDVIGPWFSNPANWFSPRLDGLRVIHEYRMSKQ